MKVAFWYEVRIRNDGPPLYLKSVVERHKKDFKIDELEHWIPLKDKVKMYGDYDLNIWVDFGDDALEKGYGLEYEKVGKPNAYWVSDSHVGLEYRLKKAKEFDYVFVAIKDHVKLFKKKLGHNKVYWLPHAAEPIVYHSAFVNLFEHLKKAKDYKGKNYGYWTTHEKELIKEMDREGIKKHDICFIGHLNSQKRIDALDKLFKAIPEFYYNGSLFFEAAARKYMDSKIVFNISIGKEANMRAFEAPLSGSLLLTDKVKDLEELGFKDGVNCVFYKDIKEAIKKAKYYLKHDKEREKIAKAGQELVLNNHTYLHRAKELFKIINNIK